MLLSPFYAAPTGVQAPEFKGRYGGTLRIAYLADPISFNGFVNYWGTTESVLQQVLLKLGTFDDLYNVVGEVMKSFTVSEEPGFPSVYTIEIEDNIYWHDGVHMTTQDLKFHFETLAWAGSDRTDAPSQDVVERLEQPAYNSGTFLSSLKKIEIVDDYVVKFYFNKPRLDSWITTGTDADFNMVPYHLWKDFNIHNPPGQRMDDNQYNHKPLGNGPYTIAEYERDQYIIMDRFDEFFRGVPYLEHLVWNIIPDRVATVLALENGEVDTVHQSVNFPSDEIARINAMPQFTVRGFPYTTTYRATPNFHPDGIALWPWLADKDVLKALEYAIDKQTICTQVLNDVTKPTYTAISWIVAPYGGDYNTVDQGYTGDWPIVKREYDPDMARTLLDDAGWTLNDAGVRHKVIDGVDHTMDNFEVPYYHFATNWAEAIMAYWEEVGVFGKAVPIESTSFYAGIEDSAEGLMGEGLGGPFPIGFNSMGAGPDPDRIKYTTQARNAEYPWVTGATNFGFYVNDRVDELFDVGAATSDYAARKEAYDEMQYLIHEDVGWIFLFNKWRIEAWNNDFAGFDTNLPLSWYGNYFRGNQTMSNTEDGVYWRGGTEEPFPQTMTSVVTSIATTTQVIPEFMDIRILAALSILILPGILLYRRRYKRT
jgi:peptide/nickel transport system substrate-binding protein